VYIEGNNKIMSNTYKNRDLDYWEKFFSSDKQLRFPQEMVIRFFHGCNLAGSNILDLGCGNGVNGLYAETLGCDVTYLDYSINALNQLKVKTNKPIIHSGIESLDSKVEDVAFDAIISTSVLYHFDKKELKEIIKNICKKLTNGGMFFGNFISFNDPLVKETVTESGVNYLLNEAWITSRNNNVESESRIIFESFHKDELKELFKDFRTVKIYSSSTPASLTRDSGEASSRDSYWVLALK
jgi:cyclopropane fatty-acyl-phospholipid synthase-like methyltransferase